MSAFVMMWLVSSSTTAAALLATRMAPAAPDLEDSDARVALLLVLLGPIGLFITIAACITVWVER